MIHIEKKTVKHTLRITESESSRLRKQAEKSGISQAALVRRRVFGLEPAPMPGDAFWNHMEDLYAIHDRIADEAVREQLRELILEIQTEATAPRKVAEHGNDEAVAH